MYWQSMVSPPNISLPRLHATWGRLGDSPHNTILIRLRTVNEEKPRRFDTTPIVVAVITLVGVLATVAGTIVVARMTSNGQGDETPPATTQSVPVQSSSGTTTPKPTQQTQPQPQTADGNDTSEASMSISPEQVALNQEFTVNGSGFPPSSGILINVGGTQAEHAQTNSTGTFVLKLRLIFDPGCSNPVDVVATDQKAAVVAVTQLHCTA